MPHASCCPGQRAPGPGGSALTTVSTDRTLSSEEARPDLPTRPEGTVCSPQAIRPHDSITLQLDLSSCSPSSRAEAGLGLVGPSLLCRPQRHSRWH